MLRRFDEKWELIKLRINATWNTKTGSFNRVKNHAERVQKNHKNKNIDGRLTKFNRFDKHPLKVSKLNLLWWKGTWQARLKRNKMNGHSYRNQSISTFRKFMSK